MDNSLSVRSNSFWAHSSLSAEFPQRRAGTLFGLRACSSLRTGSGCTVTLFISNSRLSALRRECKVMFGSENPITVLSLSSKATCTGMLFCKTPSSSIASPKSTDFTLELCGRLRNLYLLYTCLVLLLYSIVVRMRTKWN